MGDVICDSYKQQSKDPAVQMMSSNCVQNRSSSGYVTMAVQTDRLGQIKWLCKDRLDQIK